VARPSATPRSEPAPLKRLEGLLSIHDVAPSVLDRVEDIVRRVVELGAPPPLLLVVPNVGWDDPSLHRLRQLIEAGCSLAGHGWEHQAPPPASLYHRLHGLVLSRDQAEHLSRSTEDLVDRVSRCHAWFEETGLPVPELYVPPAWALGALHDSKLETLPFRYVESLSGFIDTRTGQRVRVPVIGFEADTQGRRLGLTVWNRLQVSLARWLRIPLRISIHPRDLELLLADELIRTIDRTDAFPDTVTWLRTRTPPALAARG